LGNEILFLHLFFLKICVRFYTFLDTISFHGHFLRIFGRDFLFIYEFFLKTSDAPPLQVLDCPELNRKACLTAFW